MMNDEYAIYLRKSRSDIELEKYNKKLDTLDRHMKILNNLCTTENYNVTKVYKEVVSGETINERKEMQALIKDIRENKYRGVLVVEISRLSRGDKIDQGRIAKIFKYTNTVVITPDKVYDLSNEKDEEAFEDELTNSGKELKTIKKRLNRGKRSSVLEGKYVGSIPPYGYKRVKIENDKGFTLVENIEEAIIVKKIFEMFVSYNLGYKKISNKLNKLGTIPRKGENWSPSTIKDILRNPVYVGKIRWNYRPEKKYLKEEDISVCRPRNYKPLIIDGIHEQIVDEAIWNLAQVKINNKVLPIQVHNSIKNPLAHILVCKKCGKYMQRRPYCKTMQEDVIQCIHENCNNVSSKLKIVEETIVKALQYWLSEYKINVYKLLQKSKFNIRQEKSNKIKSLKKAICKEKDRIKKIMESYEDGIYDKITYKERYDITRNKIQILKEELSKIIQQDNLTNNDKNGNNSRIEEKMENETNIKHNAKSDCNKSESYNRVKHEMIENIQQDNIIYSNKSNNATTIKEKTTNKIKTKHNIKLDFENSKCRYTLNIKTAKIIHKDNNTEKDENVSLMDIYKEIDNPAEKNKFLRAIVEKIEYKKEKGSNITLIIHPKLSRNR